VYLKLKLTLKLIYDRRSVGQWCRAPIWNPWPDVCIQSATCWFFDEGCPLWREDGPVIYSYNCFWALPEQSFSGPSLAELMTIFYCSIWDSPNLEDQVPVFISPTNRVAQLNPWALGSLFVSSFGSSYIATDGQSASSSWCRCPFGAGDQILHFFE
jgi:hypothetical protein